MSQCSSLEVILRGQGGVFFYFVSLCYDVIFIFDTIISHHDRNSILVIEPWLYIYTLYILKGNTRKNILKEKQKIEMERYLESIENLNHLKDRHIILQFFFHFISIDESFYLFFSECITWNILWFRKFRSTRTKHYENNMQIQGPI